MDIKSIFNDPKQRLIVLISLFIIVGAIGGYYIVANYVLTPQEEPVITTPKAKTTTGTYTFAEILETLTEQIGVVFTYSNVALGRSNPFLPVIDLNPKPQPKISSLPQATTRISIVPQSSSVTKTWYSNFKLTGIIRSWDKSYAIIEEGDRGYIIREGELFRGDIYLEKILENSVILRKGKETTTIKLGGE
uniref:Uncharacterized protein n=1 Tax=Dictyoglomus thermophilum TaxID=14 RepID=A0A7C3RVC4_DICTH